MSNYVIPFWIVVSVVIVIVGIMIWMAVVKSKDNRAIEIGYVGVHYLLEHYLMRCLNTTVYMILKYEQFKTQKGLDIRLSMGITDFVPLAVLLSKTVLRFARGREIISQLVQEVKPSTQTTNIFLLPDVLILQARVHFYRDLLSTSFFIVHNEGESANPFSSYTEDQAKQYLSTLFHTVNQRATNKKGKPMIEYTL